MEINQKMCTFKEHTKINAITYCFICPIEILQSGDSVIESYKEISQFMIDAMKKLGVELNYGTKKPKN